MSMVMQWAKTAFLAGLSGLRGGTLSLKCPDRMYRFGADEGLEATLVVHDERFFLRALTGSDIGIGESFGMATGRHPIWCRSPGSCCATVTSSRTRAGWPAYCIAWPAESRAACATTPSPAVGAICTATTTSATTSFASSSTPNC